MGEMGWERLNARSLVSITSKFNQATYLPTVKSVSFLGCLVLAADRIVPTKERLADTGECLTRV
jgi:hypothetical protein